MADIVIYTLVFLLVFTQSGEGSTSARTCVRGAAEHNGKCYTLYTAPKTFYTATATCRGVPGGGDLVTVDSADTQLFVRNLMEQSSINNLWLGAKMSNSDWRWVKSGKNMKYQGCFSNSFGPVLNISASSKVNNTPESCVAECYERKYKYAGVTLDYNSDKVTCRCGDIYLPYSYVTSGCDDKCVSDSSQKCGTTYNTRIYCVDSAGVDGWSNGQPDNDGRHQTCLVMLTSGSYKWADEACHGTGKIHGYICEFADSQENGCATHAGKCFTAHKGSHHSWYEAQAVCIDGGGHLLEVDTEDIFDNFNTGSVKLEHDVEAWWIGGSRERWMWPGECDLTYTNWAPRKPASASNRCAIIAHDTGSSYQWTDVPCSATYSFVCEMEIDVITSTEATMTSPMTSTPTTSPMTSTPTTSPMTSTPTTTTPEQTATGPTQGATGDDNGTIEITVMGAVLGVLMGIVLGGTIYFFVNKSRNRQTQGHVVITPNSNSQGKPNTKTISTTSNTYGQLSTDRQPHDYTSLQLDRTNVDPGIKMGDACTHPAVDADIISEGPNVYASPQDRRELVDGGVESDETIGDGELNANISSVAANCYDHLCADRRPDDYMSLQLDNAVVDVGAETGEARTHAAEGVGRIRERPNECASLQRNNADIGTDAEIDVTTRQRELCANRTTEKPAYLSRLGNNSFDNALNENPYETIAEG